ncbi:uncharacterized protein LOC142576422 [Dermacentor variabilis]|uniref:uncharacterized protein LOC142576422 n=1 Tax=Dermacentor variabilis TaxID=34621 RepID=UPI003F5B3D52
MDGTSAAVGEARTPKAVRASAETVSAAAANRAKKARHTYCAAPNCECSKTRHRQEHDGRRCSLFGMPRDEQMFRRWQRYMPPRAGGKRLTPQSALCERHFDPQFVLRYYEHTINGEVVRIMRGKPSLTPDAVPTMFPDSPSYYTRHVPRRRKPVQRVALPPLKPKRTSATTSSAKTSSADVAAVGDSSEVEAAVAQVPATSDADPVVIKCEVTPGVALPAPKPKRTSATTSSAKISSPDVAAVGDASEVEATVTQLPATSDAEPVVKYEVTPAFPYKDLPLPSSQWACHVISEKPLVIAYSTCRVSKDEPGRLVTEKLVLVREHEDHAECHVYLEGRRLSSFEGAGGTDYPDTLLQRLDSIERCPGLGRPEEFHLAEHLPPYVEMRESRLHSIYCSGMSTTRTGLSEKCQHARSLLRKKRARLERKMRMPDHPPVREVVMFTEPSTPPLMPADIAGASHGEIVEREFKADVQGNVPTVELVLNETEGGPVETGLGESEYTPALEVEDETAVPYRVVISGQVPIYVQ